MAVVVAVAGVYRGSARRVTRLRELTSAISRLVYAQHIVLVSQDVSRPRCVAGRRTPIIRNTRPRRHAAPTYFRLNQT